MPCDDVSGSVRPSVQRGYDSAPFHDTATEHDAAGNSEWVNERLVGLRFDCGGPISFPSPAHDHRHRTCPRRIGRLAVGPGPQR